MYINEKFYWEKWFVERIKRVLVFEYKNSYYFKNKFFVCCW